MSKYVISEDTVIHLGTLTFVVLELKVYELYFLLRSEELSLEFTTNLLKHPVFMDNEYPSVALSQRVNLQDIIF